MHLVSKLYFLTLEKRLSTGDVLCIPAVHAPLVVQAACSRDSPHEGCVVPFVVAGYVGGLIGLVDPGLFIYQALPCIEAIGCWLLGPGHRAVDCRIPWALGQELAPWWVDSRLEDSAAVAQLLVVKPGPGVSARILAGRAESWSLVAGLRGPRVGVRSLLLVRWRGF